MRGNTLNASDTLQFNINWILLIYHIFFSLVYLFLLWNSSVIKMNEGYLHITTKIDSIKAYVYMHFFSKLIHRTKPLVIIVYLHWIKRLEKCTLLFICIPTHFICQCLFLIKINVDTESYLKSIFWKFHCRFIIIFTKK